MNRTIDELFAEVISLSARVQDTNKRNDYQQLARIAYQIEDYKQLRQFRATFQALPPLKGFAPQRPRPHVKLASDEEASGMLNPRVYNYFSNFNSPLNPPPRKLAYAYPLYANFGGYDKRLA